jgi:uncharacterized alkaline shock family protein YloU
MYVIGVKAGDCEKRHGERMGSFMMSNEQEAQENAADKKGIGEVKIASDVVAVIAGLAANEVEGVSSMAGNITNELIGKLGMKNMSKGVKVTMEEGVVRVDMALNMKYGYSIPKVTKQVQEKVSQQIENMTGLVVPEVNVRVAGVSVGE